MSWCCQDSNVSVLGWGKTASPGLPGRPGVPGHGPCDPHWPGWVRVPDATAAGTLATRGWVWGLFRRLSGFPCVTPEAGVPGFGGTCSVAGRVCARPVMAAPLVRGMLLQVFSRVSRAGRLSLGGRQQVPWLWGHAVPGALSPGAATDRMRVDMAAPWQVWMGTWAPCTLALPPCAW